MLVLSETKKKEILDDLEKSFLDVSWSEVETPTGTLLKSQEVYIFFDSGQSVIKIKIFPEGEGQIFNLIFRSDDPFLQRAKNIFFKIKAEIIRHQLSLLAFKLRCIKES